MECTSAPATRLSPHTLWSALMEVCGGMSWSGAAKHYEGSEGSFEAAGMIRNVLTAGFWTEDRLAKAGYESSTNGKWPRCGLEAETAAHRFWSCR
eukprot:714773-Pyramimonas_sp.AAC.1